MTWLRTQSNATMDAPVFILRLAAHQPSGLGSGPFTFREQAALKQRPTSLDPPLAPQGRQCGGQLQLCRQGFSLGIRHFVSCGGPVPEHGGTAVWVGAQPVKEVFEGKTV
jgi:hypothetical protein